MRNIGSALSLAFSLLTTLPTPRIKQFHNGIFAQSAILYPLVGFILGYILHFIHQAFSLGFSDTYSLLLTFAFWIILTGAIHLDGVLDTIDGLFASPKKSLEVMKDPRSGAMAVIFGTLFLAIKAFAFIELASTDLLPYFLLCSRLVVVIAIYFGNYISVNGMSSQLQNEFKLKHFILSILLTLGFLSTCTIPVSTLIIAIALLIYLFFHRWFHKRFGGFNGDMYGFIIEGTELALLNAFILYTAL